MKFKITKKVSMEEYGEDFKDSYLEFCLITERDAQDLKGIKPEDNEKATMDLLRSKFAGGKAMSEGKLIEVTVEDLMDIPIEFLLKCLNAISGQISPN